MEWRPGCGCHLAEVSTLADPGRFLIVQCPAHQLIARVEALGQAMYNHPSSQEATDGDDARG